MFRYKKPGIKQMKELARKKLLTDNEQEQLTKYRNCMNLYPNSLIKMPYTRGYFFEEFDHEISQCKVLKGNNT